MPRARTVPRFGAAVEAAVKGKADICKMPAGRFIIMDRLARKREQRDAIKRLYAFQWEVFVKAARNAAQVNREEFDRSVVSVITLADQLRGENDPITPQGAAVAVLQLYHERTKIIRADVEFLRPTLARVGPKCLRRVSSAVRKLIGVLPEGFYQDFIAKSAKLNVPIMELPYGNEAPIQPPHSVEVSHGVVMWDKLRDLSIPMDTSSVVSSPLSDTGERRKRLLDEARSGAMAYYQWNRSWIAENLQAAGLKKAKTPAGLRKLVNEVVDIMESSEPSAAIESELFDLLGFDCFELIAELVQRRPHAREASKPVDFNSMTDAFARMTLGKTTNTNRSL